MQRDGDAPYRDPWAGGVLTLAHHPAVLHAQAVAARTARGDVGVGSTAVLLGVCVVLWLAAMTVAGGC